MADLPPQTITELLHRVGDDADAFDALLPFVYGELRALAAAHLRQERPDHTLQATALVHEAYLKLAAGAVRPFTDRGHFFRVAARAMRQILVDHARARRTARRDGGVPVELPPDIAAAQLDADVVAVDEALQRLAALDPRQAQVIELRYFTGFSIDETATALGISPATVKRDWMLARAWLQREIGDA